MGTKGIWYPDRTKATDKDPALYLHISATTKDILQKGIDKVNELLSQDLGPLIEDRRGRDRERVSLAFLHSLGPSLTFMLSENGRRRKCLSPSSRSETSTSELKSLVLRSISCPSPYPFVLMRSQGTFVKYIQQETGTRVQIKGIGSGFINQETGQEDPEPMHIHITFVACWGASRSCF